MMMGRWVCFQPKPVIGRRKIRRETPTFATEFCGEDPRTLSGKTGVSQKSGVLQRDNHRLALWEADNLLW
jgi:hypothetical protein